jgi:hypothetical protein
MVSSDFSSNAPMSFSLSIMPEIKVELPRLVPCGVTYHEIARNREIERRTKHAIAQGNFRH